MSGEITVRQARRADRSRILDIAADSFDGVSLDQNIERVFGVMGEDWRRLKQEAVYQDLVAHSRAALVAEVDGEVVGFSCNRLHPSRSCGHIANLAVAPAHQGKGVGKALVRASLQLFRDNDLEFARIETLEQNERAEKFYPSEGFREVGRQIYYFMEL